MGSRFSSQMTRRNGKIEEKSPFTMTLTLNGESFSFETFPSNWIMVDENQDYNMTEDDFMARLVEEYSLENGADAFTAMLYEAGLSDLVVKDWSVEIVENE